MKGRPFRARATGGLRPGALPEPASGPGFRRLPATAADLSRSATRTVRPAAPVRVPGPAAAVRGAATAERARMRPAGRRLRRPGRPRRPDGTWRVGTAARTAAEEQLRTDHRGRDRGRRGAARRWRSDRLRAERQRQADPPGRGEFGTDDGADHSEFPDADHPVVPDA